MYILRHVFYCFYIFYNLYHLLLRYHWILVDSLHISTWNLYSLSLISLKSFRERESSFVRCRILSGDLVARVSGLTPASGGSHSTVLAGLCFPCVGLYLPWMAAPSALSLLASYGSLGFWWFFLVFYQFCLVSFVIFIFLFLLDHRSDLIEFCSLYRKASSFPSEMV